MDGEYVRVDSSQAPGTPVDYVQGSVCGTMVLVGLCGHSMYATSDVTADPTTGPWSRTRALYIGSSLVLAHRFDGLSGHVPEPARTPRTAVP